uniref:Protein krueppel n=1 Tax=Stomoxys calcitrans TaxID=35570 RepID=A0A1I8NZB4_STOCA
MDKQKNVYNKCRTCLNKNKGMHSLEKMAIEDSTRKISYAQLLREITNINLEDDRSFKMPQFICACCSRKLKSSHAFITQAKESNDKLLAMITTEIPPDKPPPLDCLQESQIDIETCLEIKMESGDENEEKANKQVNLEKDKPMDLEDKSMEDKIALETEKASDKDTKETLEEALDELPLTPDNDFEFDSNSSKRDADFSDGSGGESDNEDFTTTDPSWQTENEASTHKGNRGERKRNSSKDDSSTDLAIAVPCLKCNKIFKNSKVLSRHLRNTHVPEEQKCTCPLCGVKFTRTCNMFKHMRTQHDPDTVKTLLPASEKMHQCDKCPQKYTKKKHLNNHIKAKHTNESETGEKTSEDSKAKAEDRSLCSICGCSFSKKAYLIVHMRRHTGERPFKCDLCDRAFPHNSELKCHRRIHTGEKPYKCKLCEKAFRVYKKLATHMRSHTDERPYKCNQCERSFKYSKDLNIHHRIHTGERPYCCTVCGSTFTQSNSLKAHRMKLGHMEDNAQAAAAPPQPPPPPPTATHLLT